MTLGLYAQTLNRRSVDRDLVWRLMAFADELNETAIETMANSERVDG